MDEQLKKEEKEALSKLKNNVKIKIKIYIYNNIYLLKIFFIYLIGRSSC